MHTAVSSIPEILEKLHIEPLNSGACYGDWIANPAGAVWSASLMLESLGEAKAAVALMNALESVCRDGPRTRDVGGSAATREVGDAIAARLAI